MVDRQARDTLAEALRHLVSGQITNDDLENAVPVSADRGIRAVYGQAWYLYSDNYRHRLRGRHRVPETGREIIARWILFLHSNHEYAWPDYDFFQIVNWPMNVLTLGWWERRKRQRFAQFQGTGHWEVWPFVRTVDFEAARQEARLLSGHSR